MNEMLRILKRQKIDIDVVGDLAAIAKQEKNLFDAMMSVFNYGVICGKREERRRRKEARNE